MAPQWNTNTVSNYFNHYFSGMLSVSDLANPIRVLTHSSYSFVAKSGVGSQRISGIVCFEVGPLLKQF